MVASKKSKAAATTKSATQPESATGKKVSFAQEKRVKTFHKDKALLKRKADDEQDTTTNVKKAKKSAIRQAKKPVEQVIPSSDEEEETDVVADLVANDTELEALTEEQEEALRKEILGDLVDEDDNEDDSSDDDDDNNDQLDQDNDLIGANANVVSLKNKKKDDNTKVSEAADCYKRRRTSLFMGFFCFCFIDS
jgi:nucleolar protein 15